MNFQQNNMLGTVCAVTLYPLNLLFFLLSYNFSRFWIIVDSLSEHTVELCHVDQINLNTNSLDNMRLSDDTVIASEKYPVIYFVNHSAKIGV